MKRDKAQAIYERAAAVIPGGVNSNFRYWGPDETPVAGKAQGAYIWDADGKKYVDVIIDSLRGVEAQDAIGNGREAERVG